MSRARGFTLVELLIVIGVISILFSIAVPWLLAARMSAHEASAISSLQAINDGQAVYREVCGKGHYAPSLPALGEPSPSSGQAFISPDLASADVVEKSGYRVAMGGEAPEAPVTSCTGADTLNGYFATADPLRPGSSGRRFFGTNAGRVIYDNSETFTGKMPEMGPPEAGSELR